LGLQTRRPKHPDSPIRGASMKLMINGTWHADADAPPELPAEGLIQPGRFRRRITADGSSGFPAEPDRYHLYVSYACPFSHRVLIARALKALNEIVGLSVLHPLWDTSDGWVFGDTPMSTADGGGSGFLWLYEAYLASCPNYTGKVTVPVLWDKKTRTIVCNESLEIVQMLNDAFDGISGDCGLDLCPGGLKQAVDELNARITRSLAAGVYAIAGARNQGEYDAAMYELFGFLDDLDCQLRDGRQFLLGERPTLADVLAYATLVRFDVVYNPLFRASRRRVMDYPHLPSLLRQVYGLPGVAGTLRYDHILTHYYDGDWAVATRRGIVPELPAANWLNRA
jgi:glutathionyl-hydroquinone reductase